MLKYFELPHVSKYKWTWLRRVMICVTFPQEIVRSMYQTCLGAKFWWNWDGNPASVPGYVPPAAPSA